MKLRSTRRWRQIAIALGTAGASAYFGAMLTSLAVHKLVARVSDEWDRTEVTFLDMFSGALILVAPLCLVFGCYAGVLARPEDRKSKIHLLNPALIFLCVSYTVVRALLRPF